MAKNLYIECGKVINTHGCHGGLKLESWCNTPETLAAIEKLYFLRGEKYLELTVKKASVFKSFVLVETNEIMDMDAALAVKNEIVYARRSDFVLSEGEYFIADLVGLPVVDASTLQVYGTLKETVNRGASDIYVIETPSGEKMIPAVKEFIHHIDMEKGIFVTPIEGMLD